MLGLFFLSLGIVLILPFDTSMSLPLPTWMYFVFVLLIFLGQTLDAIDGKHARNTKRSSPLGQLMDHGCDAFSNSFVIIMIAQAHCMGNSFFVVLAQVLVQLPFYTFTWEEYHTGILITHLNNLGVTEFQFIGMIVLLIPVFLGHSFSKLVVGYQLTVADLIVILNGVL